MIPKIEKKCGSIIKPHCFPQIIVEFPFFHNVKKRYIERIKNEPQYLPFHFPSLILG